MSILKDVIAKMLEDRSKEGLRKLNNYVDHLRFDRGHTYSSLFALFREADPSIDLPAFEDLMQRLDEVEGGADGGRILSGGRPAGLVWESEPPR